MARLILVADDSPIIQRKAQKILEDEGFEVQTVSNGVAAVKKLPALQPALVLADVSMPGKDGYEVCEFVKTSAGLRHVPVLLVGSDLEPYDEPRGAKVRADGVIKKPFTPQDLVAMVTRLTGPANAPESLPELAGTTVAASPEALPGGSVDSPIIPAEPVLREEGEEGVQLPDVEPLLREADGSLSRDEPHPHDAPIDLLEPPGFALVEAAPKSAFAGPETSQEIEEPGTRQIGDLILPPQLLDLTSSDSSNEPAPVIAETIPEPAPEPAPNVAPEPAVASPEGSREVEELLSCRTERRLASAPEGRRAVEEPRHQEVDDLTSTSELPGISTPQPLESTAPPDPRWVYKVVLKVVTRMAPPVLAPEHVEEIARMLAGEITAELGGVVEHPDLAPESPSSK